MRFTLSSTTLSKKLQDLSKVINSKNSIAILGDFLFAVDNNTLSLTASDGENTVKTSMELAESDGTFSFAIPSNYILEAVKGFSEQPLTFELNNELTIAKISYLNGHYSLPVESTEAWPNEQPLKDEITEITIPSNVLTENIARSLFAVGQGDLRPQMNGVYFDITNDHLAIVATDGHKLVRNKVLNIKADNPAAFILPKKPAALLRNMLPQDDGEVNIKFDERNALISFNGGTLQCRMIEGRYPNYNAVIPQNNTNVMTIDRAGLLGVLKRIVPFANSSSNLIRFHLENGILQLDAEDNDFSKTATERITCEYGGQPMSIGFKGATFIEVLSSFTCPEIQLHLADSSRPGLVIPSEQPENQDVLMLLMPMLLND